MDWIFCLSGWRVSLGRRRRSESDVDDIKRSVGSSQEVRQGKTVWLSYTL